RPGLPPDVLAGHRHRAQRDRLDIATRHRGGGQPDRGRGGHRHGRPGRSRQTHARPRRPAGDRQARWRRGAAGHRGRLVDGAAPAGRRGVRARSRGRVRRCAGARPAVRLGAGEDRPLRQCRGRAGGRPARLRRRDADQRRDRGDVVRLTDAQWTDLLRVRATDPSAVTRAYAARRRRRSLLRPGRDTLFLVAADHPARGALAIGGDPLAMANRRSLLERLLTALANPEVDGVLASPDVVEELLLLDALHDKVVIGSMNRGGLAGATWEIDDRFTGYDAASIARYGLDGGKMLLRL